MAVRQNDHCCLRSKWSRNNISFFLKFWDWIWNPIHALACSGIRCIVHNFLFYQFKYPCAGFRYQTATAPFKMAQVLASFKCRLQLVELEVRAERLKCDVYCNQLRFLQPDRPLLKLQMQGYVHCAGKISEPRTVEKMDRCRWNVHISKFWNSTQAASPYSKLACPTRTNEILSKLQQF